MRVLEDAKQDVSPELREMAGRAERQAAKHAREPELKGDAYFVSLKKGLVTKNVNLQKQLLKEAEEADIEKRIFGDADEDASTAQAGKRKPQHQQKRHPPGHGGKKGKGKH